jgi:hypothetical protein
MKIKKFWCRHRWSTIKRWSVNGQFFVIQRCRRCDRWIRRHIELADAGLNMETLQFKDKDVTYKAPNLIDQVIQPLERREDDD